MIGKMKHNIFFHYHIGYTSYCKLGMIEGSFSMTFFFKYRFGPAAHLLQSAKHAVNAGLPEKMVLAWPT